MSSRTGHNQMILGLPSNRPELGCLPQSAIHSYTTRHSSARKFDVLHECSEAANLLWSIDKNMRTSGFLSSTNVTLPALEKTVLDLAAYGVTQGIFYAILVKTCDKFVIRYIESGSFLGFLKDSVLDFIAASQGISKEDLLPYRVYTSEDVRNRSTELQKRRASISKSRSKPNQGKSLNRNRDGEIYKRLLSSGSNSIQRLPSCLQESRRYNNYLLKEMIMFTQKTRTRASKGIDRYFNILSGETHAAAVQDLLREYVLHGSPSSPPLSSFEDIQGALGPLSLKQQFDILSAVPNNHWWQYPKCNQKCLTGADTKVGLLRHFSFCPDIDVQENTEESDSDDERLTEGDKFTRHLPTSARNRLIFFLAKKRIFHARKLVHFLESGDDDLSHSSNAADAPPPSVQSSSQQRKTRTRVIHVGVGDLEDRVQITRSLAKNMMHKQHKDQYLNFRENIITDGVLLWRLHTLETDVWILNDYDNETGLFMPYSFVHLTRIIDTEGEISYICDCAIYSWLRQTAMTADNSDQLGLIENVAISGATCMHCRFFKEEIEEHLNSLSSEAFSPDTCFKKRLLESLGQKNDEVVPLKSQNAAKFSVASKVKTSVFPTCSFVHISCDGKFIKCTSGLCQAGMGNKKSAHSLIDDITIKKTKKDEPYICDHLDMMRAHRQLWSHLLPHSTDRLEDSSNCVTGMENEPSVNEDDRDLPAEQDHRYFNTETQKWDWGGFSTHKPAPEFDLKLSSCIRKRMKLQDANFSLTRDGTGCLTGYDLVPDLPAECSCDAGYADEEHSPGKLPKYSFKTTVYTRHGPAKHQVYYRECMSSACKKYYSGEQDCLFFLSKDTAAGDEIGWDFVNRVKTSKVSFSAFCTEMTRQYKTINILSASFMTRKTFVSWFFAWAAKMNLDFRKCIDPWCSYKPKTLACDGTHIGISQRHLNITPIDCPTMNTKVATNHRRYDRTFIHYKDGVSNHDLKQARQHLLYLSKKALSELPLGDVKSVQAETAATEILKQCLPSDLRVVKLIGKFIRREFLPNVLLKLARVLKILAQDAPVSALVPPQFGIPILQAVNGILSNDQAVQGIMQELRNYAPEIRDLLLASRYTENGADVCSFLRYLVSFIDNIHQRDEPYSPAEPQPGTYNPEKGVAYYFTEHGNIVRHIPHYLIEGGRTYDDDPDETCNKKYPSVSYGGYTYLFLWFCPIHGHSYGFHIIDGGEGRKDPFSSLVKYLPEPPQDIFYDFACGFSEYSLNREPDFFKETRFWHDIFHGFAHKCAASLKSTRILSLKPMNSEICEQFNSFLQCIKYTASHLSQSRFTFFLQFFISIWNEQKTDNFLKKVAVALGGCA